MGKYPVISITLKSMKQYSYESAFEMLKEVVGEEYKRHWDEVVTGGRLGDADLERYQRIRDLEGTDGDYAFALKFVS